jgi:subtilisin family serine protease
VVRHNPGTGKVKIVSMSLGGGYSQVLNDAVNQAVTDGVTVVVAAGNDAGAHVRDGGEIARGDDRGKTLARRSKARRLARTR